MYIYELINMNFMEFETAIVLLFIFKKYHMFDYFFLLNVFLFLEIHIKFGSLK